MKMKSLRSVLSKFIQSVGVKVYKLGRWISPGGVGSADYQIIEVGTTEIQGINVATYWTIPGGGEYIGSLRHKLSDGSEVTVDMGSMGRPVGLQIVNCNGIKPQDVLAKLVEEAQASGQYDTD